MADKLIPDRPIDLHDILDRPPIIYYEDLTFEQQKEVDKLWLDKLEFLSLR